MLKPFLIILFCALLYSCGNNDPKIFGVYTDYNTDDLITIDCDYHVSFPSFVELLLPPNHDNEIILNTSEIGGTRITLSVDVDNMRWPFGYWEQYDNTIEINKRIYKRSEVLLCR